MVHRYFLYIDYDGTDYSGWQYQPNHPTVQAEIENALKIYFRENITIYGSGRTDAGVHASAQVAHFDWKDSIDLGKVQRGINGILPKDIRIWKIREVNPEIHARFDATHRAYTYRFVNRQTAIKSRISWFTHVPVNIELMQKAAAFIPTVTNFNPFSKENRDNIGSEFCTVTRSEWEIREDDEYLFHIRSNRFLHHMVRYLVGSMYRVGLGELDIEEFHKALKGEIPNYVHLKAPAAGLCLSEVGYEESVFV